MGSALCLCTAVCVCATQRWHAYLLLAHSDGMPTWPQRWQAYLATAMACLRTWPSHPSDLPGPSWRIGPCLLADHSPSACRSLLAHRHRLLGYEQTSLSSAAAPGPSSHLGGDAPCDDATDSTEVASTAEGLRSIVSQLEFELTSEEMLLLQQGRVPPHLKAHLEEAKRKAADHHLDTESNSPFEGARPRPDRLEADLAAIKATAHMTTAAISSIGLDATVAPDTKFKASESRISGLDDDFDSPLELMATHV